MAVFNASASSVAVRMLSQSMEEFRFWVPDYFKGETVPGYQGGAQFTGIDLDTQARAVFRTASPWKTMS